MGGKMDISKTFRMSEDFADWLAKQVFDLDTDLASLIRTSLLLSVPLIRECPSLLEGRITLTDFKRQQD
jgi:hypothetical protein